VHLKQWVKWWVTDQPNQLKQPIDSLYFSIGRHKNTAVGTDVIRKSLASNMFQPDGDKEARTPDPCNAIAVLYQLSYDPKLVINLLDRVSPCQGIRL
jgi:hypothetical protein